MSYQMILNTG